MGKNVSAVILATCSPRSVWCSRATNSADTPFHRCALCSCWSRYRTMIILFKSFHHVHICILNYCLILTQFSIFRQSTTLHRAPAAALTLGLTISTLAVTLLGRKAAIVIRCMKLRAIVPLDTKQLSRKSTFAQSLAIITLKRRK